jgi:hypothetical protein
MSFNKNLWYLSPRDPARACERKKLQAIQMFSALLQGTPGPAIQHQQHTFDTCHLSLTLFNSYTCSLYVAAIGG